MTTQKVTLEVEPRDQLGKGPNGRLRAAGRVPANVYGLGMKSFAISVEPRRVEELLRSASGRNTILALAMKGADDGGQIGLDAHLQAGVGEFGGEGYRDGIGV